MKFNRKLLLGMLYTCGGTLLLWFNIKGAPAGHRAPVLTSVLGFAVICLGWYYIYLGKKQQKEQMEDGEENK
jgi:hypothetical protein